MSHYKHVFNSKKIKYDTLSPLIEQYLIGIKEVNCYISMNTLLKDFYGRYKPDEVISDFNNMTPNALSSEIINIIAHYRHFFWRRYGIASNYYIYYSLEMCDYCLNVNLDYKKDHYDKHNGMSKVQEYKIINEYIEENIELIKLLTEYLPNIYFMDTAGYEPSALPQLFIEKNPLEDDQWNFIFTNDMVDYQLCNNPRTTVVSLNSDNSKVHSKMNIMSFLTKDKCELSSNFYVPVLAIAGYPKYNIEGIKGVGYKSAVKKLTKLLKEGTIADIEYETMDDIADALGYDKQLLNNNFKVLSLKNISKNITNKEIILLKKQLRNKSDNMSLMEINNKYYKNNSLMLIELMDGEE